MSEQKPETAQVYPKATAPTTAETARAANERADRWEERYFGAKSRLTSVHMAAERASRKGYDLDPEDVLEIIKGAL